MKRKVYNKAAMALVCLLAFANITRAQQTTAPTPPSPPEPVTAQSYITPHLFEKLEPLVSMGQNMNFSQDSLYRKKMAKLREQMRSLQNEMSELSREESKKAIAASRERIKAYNFKYNFKMDSTMGLKFKQMEKKFDLKFKNFNMSSRFRYDSSDSVMEKKAQNGEVKLKTKNYTKSYPVDANDKLQIENTYGKITVNTWAKNEIKVDVIVKAYADDDSGAQKLLDQTTITDSKGDNLVSFKTTLNDSADENGNHFWGTWTTNGKTSVRKVVINYVVYMPVKSALSITNRYGNTILPSLDGKISINNAYGVLSAKSLNNPGNYIKLAYVNANIGSLGNCDFKMAYGDLNIDDADKLDADLSYTTVKIGKLSGSGNISLRYGDGLQIGDLDRNLKTLSVNATYAPVKLGSVNDLNADFDVTVHAGTFLYGDKAVSVTSQTPTEGNTNWTTTKNYKGHIGKGNTDKTITIKTTYNSVKFD